MRFVSALSFALATLIAAGSASAATGHSAKGYIVAAVKQSPKVRDKAGKFKTQLGGKAGDRVRPFTANNLRKIVLPFGGPGAAKQGGVQLTIGGIVSGKINMKTNRVTISGPQMFAKGTK